LFMNVTS